jgi:hypothetical protein
VEGDQGVVDLPDSRKRGVWARVGALAVLVACVSAPSRALAVGEPTITQTPQISGTAQVGQTLIATTGAWDGDPPVTATYAWLSCAEAPAEPCVQIADATGLSYVPVAEDVGHPLRIFLTVTNASGEASVQSDPTSAVGPADEPVPPPPPDPETVPAPNPGPEPSLPPAPDPEPAPAPATTVAPALTLGVVGAFTAPRLLDPFPVVRIRGRSTGTGARITLLTVRSPRGARVGVSCSGAGCPTRRWGQTAALTRVRAFERVLPAGVRLTITVTQPGWIGKQTVLLIRRSRAPLRRDRCLYPGSALPRPCPS